MILALADGGSLAYEIHGDGAPLLLVRPLGGTMALWGEFRAQLARQYRVVSFDLRGTGGSRSAPAWSTTRELAGDAVALLDHLRIERAHVFGISLGSMIATWLAIDNPSRVIRLCLASTCARGVELSRAGLRRELSLAACFLHRQPQVESDLVMRVLSERFRARQPAQVAHIEAIVRHTPASRRTLAALATAGLRHDARAGLSGIAAPTLVLAGANDELLGTAPSRAVSDAIAGASFAILPSGHDLTLEQPAETAMRVAAHFG